MSETRPVIIAQGLLLLSRGYTENVLHGYNQPKAFLFSLSKELKALDKKFPEVTVPQTFAKSIHADLDNGWFPVELEFTYAYLPKERDLMLVSLNASLFNTSVFYKMGRGREAELPHPMEVLKELQTKLKINFKNDVAKMKQSQTPSKGRRRLK